MKKRPDFRVRWVTVGPGPEWLALFVLEKTDETIVVVWKKAVDSYSDRRSDHSCDLSQRIGQV